MHGSRPSGDCDAGQAQVNTVRGVTAFFLPPLTRRPLRSSGRRARVKVSRSGIVPRAAVRFGAGSWWRRLHTSEYGD